MERKVYYVLGFMNSIQQSSSVLNLHVELQGSLFQMTSHESSQHTICDVLTNPISS